MTWNEALKFLVCLGGGLAIGATFEAFRKFISSRFDREWMRRCNTAYRVGFEDGWANHRFDPPYPHEYHNNKEV